ncbi:MAG: (2Fe-2S) ferredoxin domain-containing protein [Phormidesmis sp.]
MYSSNSTQFGCVGQFLAFASGEKSPYQYLTMQVAATDSASASSPVETPVGTSSLQQIKLNGALRHMMMGYLQPQDWIRVVGKVKVDARTGDPQWKAQEIVKISTQQAIQYAQQKAIQQKAAQQQSERQKIERQANSNNIDKTSIDKTSANEAASTRILICQKSSCRKRGSQAVEDAIARTLKTHGQSQHITIQPTGCMKQCKTGPHMVLISSKARQKKTSNLRYTQVTPRSANQIIKNEIIENEITGNAL